MATTRLSLPMVGAAFHRRPPARHPPKRRERQQKLAWLDGVGGDTNTCHVLSNVRCLSEGVDVPSLDAVLFLSARNSQVDVVQSVGRVMRRAPGKKYGYVIIPVVIPPEMSPEEALDNSDVYNVVWTVLNALRAHDDHFDAEINKIELNKGRSDKILVGIVETGGPRSVAAAPHATQDEFDFRAKIYAKMVKKVGTRRYWSLWAEEVAKIAARHSERLRTVISTPGAKRDEFVKFLTALRENLNPAVTEDEAAWKDCVVDVSGKQTDLLTPNGVREKGGSRSRATEKEADAQERVPPNVSRVSGEQIRLLNDSLYHVTKMRFAKKDNPTDENKNGKLDRWEIEDRSRIIYNDRVTIRGIPLAAYDYVVNGKSAIEWVMERYQITTNKDSGIVNDPNKWLGECGNERYIVDLILKVVTVSMETQKIVANLPVMEF